MITPQTEAPEVAKALGLGDGTALYLKREDLHPYGSHKGRSIPVMIDKKVAAGAKAFALSSSGNAALAAVRHIQKLNMARSPADALSLTIFIGENMNAEKRATLMAEITDPHITVKESPRPLQALFDIVKGGVVSLRQSTDDDALIGYQSLAAELARIPDLRTVFIAASSGTAAQALAEYFKAHSDQGVAVHIVQTTAVSPLVEALGTACHAPIPSIADAIVDKVAQRKTALTAAIRSSCGTGWIASDADIRSAQKLLADKAHIDVTPNGALSIAGLITALDHGAHSTGAVVCVITGR